MNEIISTCQFLLNNFPPANNTLDYVSQRISKSSRDLFQLGYFPNTEHLNSLILHTSTQPLFDNSLIYSKLIEDSQSQRSVNLSYFEDYPLIMPFKDPYGTTKAIVARSILQDHERPSHVSKYKNSKDFHKGNFLYGLFENKEHIINNNLVFVVEGQFDVIKAHENNFRNIVALGTSNMSYYQLALITRYTQNINLLLDNDEAGLKGRKTIMSKFSHLANFQNFFIPDEFKDVDEYFSAHPNTNIPFNIKNI